MRGQQCGGKCGAPGARQCRGWVKTTGSHGHLPSVHKHMMKGLRVQESLDRLVNPQPGS